MQHVWQQQSAAAAAAVSAEVQAALRDHIQAQRGEGHHQQQQEEEGAPLRQLQRLMQQHKQELVLKVRC